MFTKSSFQRVLQAALSVSSAETGKACTRAEQEASYFLLKNCLSGITFFRILHPTPIIELPEVASNFKVHDFPSAYVIIRSMFETFVNMHYILIDPKKDEEKREFRLDLWELHKLSEIQQMANLLGVKNALIQEKADELKTLKDKIISSAMFKSLKKDEQKSIMRFNEWTTVGVVKRAERSGFHTSQANFLYKFLSNYAHSEAYSLMQISAVRSPEESEELLGYIPIMYAEMILATTINAFITVFSPARDRVMKDHELVDIIAQWEGIKKMNLVDMHHHIADEKT